MLCQEDELQSSPRRTPDVFAPIWLELLPLIWDYSVNEGSLTSLGVPNAIQDELAAENPGPRFGRPRADANIYDFQLLEPATIAMRAKLWEQFTVWADETVGPGSVDVLMQQPSLLVTMLEAYGAACFSSGMPWHYYRQLLAHIQNEHPVSKLHMTKAWKLVSRWEIAEPTQHRTPMPEPALLAMASLSLFWGWERFACTILLCFYGICRIGEILKATRRDLLTPEDLLADHEKRLYLRINLPTYPKAGTEVQKCSTLSAKKQLWSTSGGLAEA